jgi:hypothetical protein
VFVVWIMEGDREERKTERNIIVCRVGIRMKSISFSFGEEKEIGMGCRRRRNI